MQKVNEREGRHYLTQVYNVGVLISLKCGTCIVQKLNPSERRRQVADMHTEVFFQHLCVMWDP